MPTIVRPFTEPDVEEFRRRGMSLRDAEWQLEVLRGNAKPAALLRPATRGDGVVTLDESRVQQLLEVAARVAMAGRVKKFVPASGAATRMFKDLLAAREKRAFDDPAVQRLQREISHFAFHDHLDSSAAAEELLSELLDESGLGYASLPKGLIAFHRYGETSRTAFAEQLVDAAHYATDASRWCRIHFTVSPEFISAFQEHAGEILGELEELTGARFEIDFSVQHHSTDTLSVGDDGELIRRADGSLLFRPGGHGALLHNLEQLDGDLVVVKNIDNVLPSHRAAEAIRWKRVLIGLAADLQQRTFEQLRAVRENEDPETLAAASAFLSEAFGREVALEREAILQALDRPLRIVGVVRNEGEPGGAPFWVEDAAGHSSVQIVESAQVDHSDPAQEAIWKSSTHFNPVDIICALRDIDGQPYRLSRYVDRNAVFLSNKSHEGKNLRALELPGLWNGAMADWNSVAVEVPAETFAPVKTVFDLLRPEHQPVEKRS